MLTAMCMENRIVLAHVGNDAVLEVSRTGHRAVYPIHIVLHVCLLFAPLHPRSREAEFFSGSYVKNL